MLPPERDATQARAIFAPYRFVFSFLPLAHYNSPLRHPSAFVKFNNPIPIIFTFYQLSATILRPPPFRIDTNTSGPIIPRDESEPAAAAAAAATDTPHTVAVAARGLCLSASFQNHRMTLRPTAPSLSNCCWHRT